MGHILGHTVPKHVCHPYSIENLTYHKKMHELVTPEMGEAPFEDFADLVRDGEIIYGSYWEHLKSGWSRRGHPNMKFVWFEDLKRDTPAMIKSIGTDGACTCISSAKNKESLYTLLQLQFNSKFQFSKKEA